MREPKQSQNQLQKIQ